MLRTLVDASSKCSSSVGDLASAGGPEVAVTEEVLSEDELAEFNPLHILERNTASPSQARNIPQPRSLADEHPHTGTAKTRLTLRRWELWEPRLVPQRRQSLAERWGRWSLRTERKARLPGDWRRGGKAGEARKRLQTGLESVNRLRPGD